MNAKRVEKKANVSFNGVEDNIEAESN